MDWLERAARTTPGAVKSSSAGSADPLAVATAIPSKTSGTCDVRVVRATGEIGAGGLVDKVWKGVLDLSVT